MGTWVTLTALGVEFAVSLDGVDEADARHFVEAWEWCEAREVAGAPESATVIRASLQDDAARNGLAREGAARDRVAREGAARDGVARDGVARDGDDRDLGARNDVARDGVAESGESRNVANTSDTEQPKVGEHRAMARSYRALADTLSGLITRVAIEARRADLLMFHAGGVADPETGNVIAFIGPSGRGKTTASIALGSVFEYVTDETLAVRDDLGVIAYGKPLSVKQPPPEQWKDQVSPSALGLNRPGARGAAAGGMVARDGAAGASRALARDGAAAASGALAPDGAVGVDARGAAVAGADARGGGADAGARGAAAPRELRLVGVVMLDRQTDFAEGQLPSIRSVGVAESVEELVPQISYLPERERPLHRLVEVLAACGGLQAVRYGEASTLPQVFSELFAAARGGEGVLTGFTGVHSAARGGEGARPIAEGAESAASATAVITLAAALHAHDGHDAGEVGDVHDAGEVGDVHDAGEVGDVHDAGEVDARAGLEAVQASYLDAIRDGDAMVVLNGTTVRVLGGIAPTIMEAATASPRTLPQLVRTVVTVHGDPDDADAAELVAAAVDELKQIGLLRVVGASE